MDLFSILTLIGFEVRFSRIFSSFPPETFARPSPIAFIPYKNNARPPINVNILNKSMGLRILVRRKRFRDGDIVFAIPLIRGNVVFQIEAAELT